MAKSYRTWKRSDGSVYFDPNAPAALSRAQERVRQALLGMGIDSRSPRVLMPSRAVYLQDRPAVKPYAPKARRTANRSGRQYLSQLMQSINAPRNVQFCVRRKIRREVMFAKNVAGRRGVGRGKSWRRTNESRYHCGG